MITDLLGSARDLHRDGIWFKDNEGRFVLFRGVNLASRTKLPPYLPTLPLNIKKLDSKGIKRFHKELENLQPEFDRMKELGINAIRFLVMWKAIEPKPNPNPDKLSRQGRIYLDLVGKVIDSLYSRGMYAIIDFHQDVAHEIYNGDGFPDWVLEGKTHRRLDAPDNPRWQLGYFINPGVRNTLHTFWQNLQVQYKGSSYRPQEHLTKTIGATARFFQSMNDGKGHPAILGYELFNEPISLDLDFETFEKKNLYSYYKNTIDEIQKSTDTEQGDKTSFLFLEPRTALSAYADMEHDFGVLDPLTNWQWQLDLSSLTDGKRIVFSFHYYDSMLFAMPMILDVSHREEKYKNLLGELKANALKNGGIPFLTEFGASNDWQIQILQEPSSRNTMVRAAMDLQYRAVELNLLNSTYWNYDLYCTEERKDNWNLENFSLLGPKRQERNLDILARPYPMRSSAEPVLLKFDLDKKHAVMKFKGSPVNARTIVYIPKSRHYKDGFEVHATSSAMKWHEDDQILIWKPNKNHNTHLLVICPIGKFSEVPNEWPEIKTLKKRIQFR